MAVGGTRGGHQGVEVDSSHHTNHTNHRHGRDGGGSPFGGGCHGLPARRGGLGGVCGRGDGRAVV
ncbi:hypothetical protein DSO57_1022858 [Entomophthora muscae]|uniref:Uncharacterized protein n=1 Tax=Entomophthora muscae TaxID=34485 RepID=A0ACC2RU52_9FUNG|nr:hypothetical protein DSO57_1022858 [Entomophthora muscae]